MIVYLDLVIISTIFVNYAFLKTLAIIFQVKIIWYRICLALIISVLALMLFIVPISYIYNIRYLLGILIGLIAFPFKKNTSYVALIASFYFVNLAFIGTLVVFNINNWLLMVVAVIYIIIIYAVQYFAKAGMKRQCFEYNVKLAYDNTKYKALWDTGNVSSFLGMPVVYFSKKYLNKNFSYLGELEVISIHGKENLPIYTGPSLVIRKQYYQVVYSFVELTDYDIILNQHMRGKND